MKNIYIYSGNDEESIATKIRLLKLLSDNCFVVKDEIDDSVELIISIGGDGTFLRAVKEGDYNLPILGINTGHLGFYADFYPDELDKVVEICSNDSYFVQHYKTINANIKSDSTNKSVPAINDVLIKHGKSSIVHFDLYIDDDFVERFSGDGLLISSSAGSTAYNYSLGGGILDPQVDVLQITPVAPTNNVMYRNMTSSLIVPCTKKINIIPKDKDNIVVVIDGSEDSLNCINAISVELSNKEIKVIRKDNYSFWSKVRSKFIGD